MIFIYGDYSCDLLIIIQINFLSELGVVV